MAIEASRVINFLPQWVHEFEKGRGYIKKILLDLDGVVVQYDFPRIVRDFFGVDLSSQAIFAYDLADVLGVSSTVINTMFKEQVYGKPNFIDGSLEILKGWQSKTWEIIIYSNRVKYMGEMNLAQWLVDNQIPFSGIDIPGMGNYEFHIDDSPTKLAASNSMTKLLYSQPWNIRCLNVTGKLIRVNSWNEIKEIVG